MRPSGLITSNPEQDFAFSPLASVVSHIRDMAYDEELAERVREALATRRGVSEKRMFGGLTFLVGGHMCCGIVGTSSWFVSGLRPTSPRSPDAMPARWTSRVDHSGAMCMSRAKGSGHITRCGHGSSGA